MADPEELTWQDQLSIQYKKILNIAPTLSGLLKDTEFFNDVLMGFPEDFKKTHTGHIATVYFNAQDFYQTMGARNRPEFVYTTIGLIAKGTRTEVHSKIINNSIYVLSRFDDECNDYDTKWNTLDGNVRNTEIAGFNIYPEKTGKSLLTTAVIQLKHDVRFRN